MRKPTCSRSANSCCVGMCVSACECEQPHESFEASGYSVTLVTGHGWQQNPKCQCGPNEFGSPYRTSKQPTRKRCEIIAAYLPRTGNEACAVRPEITVLRGRHAVNRVLLDGSGLGSTRLDRCYGYPKCKTGQKNDVTERWANAVRNRLV
jgi:hypothetical protein